MRISKSSFFKAFQVLLTFVLLLSIVGCQASPPPAETPAAPAPAEEETAEAEPSEAEVGFTKGSLAPDFTLTGLDGKTYTLSDYRGKSVQLIFWSVGCVYCMIELPELQANYRADSGYEVLAINATFQDGEETVRESVEEHGLTFPILLMKTQEDVQTAYDYNVGGIPHNVFINKDGIIESVQIGALPGKDAIDLLKKLAE